MNIDFTWRLDDDYPTHAVPEPMPDLKIHGVEVFIHAYKVENLGAHALAVAAADSEGYRVFEEEVRALQEGGHRKTVRLPGTVGRWIIAIETERGQG